MYLYETSDPLLTTSARPGYTKLRIQPYSRNIHTLNAVKATRATPTENMLRVAPIPGR